MLHQCICLIIWALLWIYFVTGVNIDCSLFNHLPNLLSPIVPSIWCSLSIPVSPPYLNSSSGTPTGLVHFQLAVLRIAPTISEFNGEGFLTGCWRWASASIVLSSHFSFHLAAVPHSFFWDALSWSLFNSLKTRLKFSCNSLRHFWKPVSYPLFDIDQLFLFVFVIPLLLWICWLYLSPFTPHISIITRSIFASKSVTCSVVACSVFRVPIRSWLVPQADFSTPSWVLDRGRGPCLTGRCQGRN